MLSPLRIGIAQIDITPEPGAALAGSFSPRYATGTDDPLYVRAIVLDNGQTRLAYVQFDLCVLDRHWAESAVNIASVQSGLPAAHISWACSHSHSSPITGVYEFNPTGWKGLTDTAWMQRLQTAFADCICQAQDSLFPARMLHTRSFCNDALHNRRLRLKDGTDINTWLLGRCPEQVQSLGSAGAVDPEIGILAFIDEDEEIRAVLWNFALHANIHFGNKYSADYPGVVADLLQKHFGAQCVALYMPGACGDINHTTPGGLEGSRQVGTAVAMAIAAAIDEATEESNAWQKTVSLGVEERRIKVPCHDFAAGNEERFNASRWPEWCHSFFQEGCTNMAKAGLSHRIALLHAWHIGTISFACVPGELFVNWGIYLKENGAFPWTYPVELSGDWLGYLVTLAAWERIGYEGIPSITSQITPCGVKQIMDELLEMLQMLHFDKDTLCE